MQSVPGREPGSEMESRREPGSEVKQYVPKREPGLRGIRPQAEPERDAASPIVAAELTR